MRARVVAMFLVVFTGSLLAAGNMERTVSAAEETTPSPRPYGVNVLWTDQHKGTDGRRYIVGEISNDTLLPIRIEFLGFSFSDASGRSGIGGRGLWMSHLDPGERHPVMACLSCWMQDPGWTPTSYKVQVRYSVATRPANRFFDVEPIGLKVTNRNTTPATVRILFVCVRGGRTVDSSLTSQLRLDPGETQVAGWWGSFTTGCDRLEMTPDSPDPPAPAFMLAVSPTVAAYGSQATLSGRAEALTSIAIQSYDQVTGWTTMEGVTTTSSADGAYSVLLPVTRMRWLRAVTGEGDAIETSLPVSSQVKGAITLAAAPATVYRGRTVTFSGSVRPALPGAVVQIQRYDTTARAWVKAATVRLSATSTYQWRWTPRTAGSYRFRTYLANQPTVTGGASAARTITVR